MAATAVAATVIGCGGGGGGGSSTGVIGGSSGGATAGTSGTITTGGTTGAPVTTGSSGTDVTQTTGGTTTTGTTGSGTTTTGSSDTAGTTGVGTTTTGSTDTTGGTTTSTTGDGYSGTTGISTTGGTSTTGTTGTSSGTGTTGTTDTTGTTGTTDGGTTGSTGGTSTALRANAIYFGEWGDRSVVSSILPDGTGRRDEGGGASAISCSVPDPLHTGQRIYAAPVGASFGIYRGASFNPASSTTLAAPAYDSVIALQPAVDGSVMMVASENGTNYVYLIANGSVTRIDQADSAALAVDGSQVAYSKSGDAGEALMIWNRAAGSSSVLTAVADSIYPSFSKDGAYVLFSSDRDASGDMAWDLYQVPSAGGAVDRVTNTPEISELGACYNEDRTRIAYVGLAMDPSQSGLYIASNSGATRIVADDSLNLAAYWTDSLGRAYRGRVLGSRFQALKPRRR